MSDTKKIELAVQDLTTALVEHAEKGAANIGNERIDAWHSLFQKIAMRVQKLEQVVPRRIADLEKRLANVESRLDDLVSPLGRPERDDIRAIIADMINDGDITLHID